MDHDWYKSAKAILFSIFTTCLHHGPILDNDIPADDFLGIPGKVFSPLVTRKRKRAAPLPLSCCIKCEHDGWNCSSHLLTVRKRPRDSDISF